MGTGAVKANEATVNCFTIFNITNRSKSKYHKKDISSYQGPMGMFK